LQSKQIKNLFPFR